MAGVADWRNQEELSPRSFSCGYCTLVVGAHRGYLHTSGDRAIYLCPNCAQPNFFKLEGRCPEPTPGEDVKFLPKDIEQLYLEARRCVGISAATASVLICRKLLMNIAVAQEAAEGQTFVSYVDHLANTGFIPPNGRAWVDHIRKKGNEANHEIKIMSADDAKELIAFLEMLLKFVYEFPARVPSLPKP